MALIMRIALPFGRYMATPWGHHVNEGAVEWPPSPWRLARALSASWHIHHAELPEDDVRSALELMCSPPTYRLPRHGTCVSRHYLPDAGDRSAKRSTGLALDAATVVAPGDAIAVEWDVFVPAAELEMLRRLSSTVSYLGRAGSRVAIEVETADAIDEGGLSPLEAGYLTAGETLDLLVPGVPLDMDSIGITTEQLHRARRTVPPSTRWVTYPRPSNGSPGVQAPLRPKPAVVEAIQFSVSGRGRPSMPNAGLLASLFRRAVTSLARDDGVLHGHVEDGPAADDHRHAHFLALNDLGRGSKIDRLVVWSPAGVSPDSVGQIAGMRSVFVPEFLNKRLGSSVDLALEYVGPAAGLDPRLVGPSRRWRSLTPVTSTRHRKRRESWDAYVEGIVRRELRHRGLPSERDGVRVEIVPDVAVTPTALRSSNVYRARTLGRDRQQAGSHVVVEFATPVSGPLAIGSLAHFGLGTLVADEG